MLRGYLLLLCTVTFLLAAALATVLLFGSPLVMSHPAVQPPIPARCSPSGLPKRVKYQEEPLAPTPEPGASQVDPTALDSRYLRTEMAIAPVAAAPSGTLRWRMGVGIPDRTPRFFAWTDPRPGWYLNWTTDFDGDAERAGALGMEFAPMVRTPNGDLTPEAATLYALALENPGHMWLIGNEPDVEWQDNATPEEYARAYNCAYIIIKRADPTAQIAIAGLSQITPLRLAWLERAWTFYQREFGAEMPVDVWNMHAFILREERDSWGVRIPPGFWSTVQGELWEIEDHTDLQLVAQQVRLMRQWMIDHGQRNKPLIISEYGVLLPAEYGFTPAATRDFMWQSFDLFNNLRDPALGYPSDDNRLVQRWVWFSSRYALYPTGNLFNAYSRPTLLMRGFSEYLAAHAAK